MNGKFLGTYPIRKIGKSEQGIHMPQTLTGTYSIYLDEQTGDITLRRQDA